MAKEKGKPGIRKGQKVKTKKFSLQGFDVEHYKRTEQYTAAVQTLFDRATVAITNAAAKGDYTPGKPFSFADYPSVQAVMQKTIQGLANGVTAVIETGSKKQWLFANQKNDAFLASIMDTSKVSKAKMQKWQDKSLDALQAFQERKIEGMNLSQRVWKYVGQFKDQIELGLDVGLGEGRSAAQLARDVKKNLQEPDRLFRRVRDKHGNLHLSKAAKAYHPGQGVYRSSVKNAQRLTRSEINMSYRESDFLRWQNLDFVVGFEIRRSTHEPLCKCKLCERLVGRYPKTFKFKGWHPQCMCYATPILMDEETRNENEKAELKAALTGKPYVPKRAKNEVSDVPDEFKAWVLENIEAQNSWVSNPYFIEDNFIDGNLAKGLKATVEKSQVDTFEQQLSAMMPEVEQARQIAKQWGLVGIETAIDSAIKQRDISVVEQSIQAAAKEDAALMSELDAWSKKMKTLSSLAVNQGVPVSKYMSMISELQVNRANWVNNKAKYIQAIQDIENDINEAKDNEQLSTLLVDVADAKAQFGSDAVHAVYDAVEKKLSQWDGEDGSLAYLKKKLTFEIQWLEKNQKHSTWQVAQKAYQKKLDEVTYKYEKADIEAQAQTAIAYLQSSKSVKAKVLCTQFANLLVADSPISELKDKLSEIEAKYQELLAKEVAKKAKAASSQFKVNEFKGKMDWSDATMYDKKRKDAAMWVTEPSKADVELRGVCMKMWGKMTAQEKKDAWDYTEGSAFINEPLRNQYYSGRKGDRGIEAGKRLSKVIDGSAYNFDMWLVRGVDVSAFEALFSISTSDIMRVATSTKGPKEDIIDAINRVAKVILLGKEGTEHAFSSCGNSKGTGFGSRPVIYNVYCPKGTKMLYVEPFSYYGHGVNGKPAYEMNCNDGLKWDGVTPQSGFGSEAECLLQKNTTFRITKVEYVGSSPYNGKWYIDVYVVNQ